MAFWKYLRGTVSFEITSASPADTLSVLNASGIKLFEVIQNDELTICGNTTRRDFQIMVLLLEKRGEKVRVLHRTGIFWTAQNLQKRKLLVAGLILLGALMLFVPTRVLFVRIEGNSAIPAKLIMEKANDCGITFGASRRSVRSEQMKNALLGAIPQLQWAGINTYGCVAVISVEERSVPDVIPDINGVSSIIASRDGIIRQCTVLQGNALCKTGQAVKAGQVLVSGYTDCGISIHATQAKAEIQAQTIRELTTVTPSNALKRDQIICQKRQYSLLIGKKLINFFKDSGIYDGSCVKMYKKYYLTLPGGFQLPVALIQERSIYYSTTAEEIYEQDACGWLQSSADHSLKAQMVAGQILSADVRIEQEEGTYSLYGRYNCLEMIGKVRKEEIIEEYGKSD